MAHAGWRVPLNGSVLAMGRNQAKPSFDRKERTPVSKKDLTDALTRISTLALAR